MASRSDHSTPSPLPPPAWVGEVDQLIVDLRGELGILPYDPTPPGLYRAADLYVGFDSSGFAGCIDQQIYARARRSGGGEIGPVEGLAQRLHDHGITVALEAFRSERRLVGVMGGHAMERGSVGYRQVVDLGRQLAAAGLCVTTGGGPGAMEAANFGAATSHLPVDVVDDLVDRLARVPTFGADPDAFIDVSLSVLDEIGELTESLSVPTWFYGHEPSNPFASHIAKYFSNSEREDGLLAIATAGIVFVQGGPGTLQEVFQDAAQNAYRTFGPPSPMVFLSPPDDPSWWQTSGVMAALDRAFVDHHGSRRHGWDLIHQVDDVPAVIQSLT